MSDVAPPRAAPRRGPLYAAAAVALAGIALSGILTVEHFRLAYGAGGPAYCPFGRTFDCETVGTSDYAVLFDVPVALLGEAAFVALLALAWLGARSPDAASSRAAAAALLAGALGGAAFAGYLLWASFAVLEAFCSLCIGVNAAVALILVLAAASLRGLSLGELIRLPLRPEALGGAGIFVAAALALHFQYDSERDLATRTIVRELDHEYAQLPSRDVRMPADRPALGPADAPVTIVVFSDFQCGHCRALGRTLARLHAEYPHDVRVVFGHFPLNAACNPTLRTTRNRDACRAALAAEAAREQGRFWEMHDRLFAVRGRLGEEKVLALAADAGLDLARFRARASAPDLAKRIGEDCWVARSLGIRGTPFVMVNGRRPPSVRLEVLRWIVDYELSWESAGGHER